MSAGPAGRLCLVSIWERHQQQKRIFFFTIVACLASLISPLSASDRRNSNNSASSKCNQCRKSMLHGPLFHLVLSALCFAYTGTHTINSISNRCIYLVKLHSKIQLIFSRFSGSGADTPIGCEDGRYLYHGPGTPTEKRHIKAFRLID